MDLFVQRKLYLFIERRRLNVYLIISEKHNLILWVCHSVGQSPDHFDVELHYENLWYISPDYKHLLISYQLKTDVKLFHTNSSRALLSVSLGWNYRCGVSIGTYKGSHIVYIYHMQYSVYCTWVVFVILQVIILEDCSDLLFYITTNKNNNTHTHTHPTPTPPLLPSWLYGSRFLNNGVWTNYKSQSWYWTISEVERLPLFNNSRENFFFKISNFLFSQCLPESSFWTFLFETLLKYDLSKTNSSPLDLCSDCCLLF